VYAAAWQFNGQNVQLNQGIYADGDAFTVRNDVVRHGVRIYAHKGEVPDHGPLVDCSLCMPECMREPGHRAGNQGVSRT
jgi:hypothetical protein